MSPFPSTLALYLRLPILTSTLALYLRPPILNNGTSERGKLVFQNFYLSEIVGPTVRAYDVIIAQLI